jgi:hypothetical protein
MEQSDDSLKTAEDLVNPFSPRSRSDPVLRRRLLMSHDPGLVAQAT